MDENILTMISTVGFPIVMCLLLYNQNLKLTDVIQDLKTAITELTAYVKGKKDDNG